MTDALPEGLRPAARTDADYRVIDGRLFVPLLKDQQFVALHLSPVQAMILAHVSQHECRLLREGEEAETAAAEIARFVLAAWTMSPMAALNADRDLARHPDVRPLLNADILEEMATVSEQGARRASDATNLALEGSFQRAADGLRLLGRLIVERRSDKEGPGNR